MSVTVILGSARETPVLGNRELRAETISTRFGPVPLYRYPCDGGEAWVLFRHGVPHRYLPNQIPYQAHAAALKSVVLGLIILATASLIVPLKVAHPGLMLLFLVLTALTFALFGFIIGIWARNFEQLQIVPLLIITPLTFLGGTFYSIGMLPPFWQTVSLFNPVVYLVSGFRWSFTEVSDVSVWVSLAMTLVFLAAGLVTVWWIFKTGYRLKQ